MLVKNSYYNQELVFPRVLLLAEFRYAVSVCLNVTYDVILPGVCIPTKKMRVRVVRCLRYSNMLIHVDLLISFVWHKAKIDTRPQRNKRTSNGLRENPVYYCFYHYSISSLSICVCVRDT